MFKEQPFGVGTGGYSSHFPEISTDLGMDLAGKKVQAHSGWIKVFAENGFPGILLMAGYVFSFAIAGIRKRRQGLLIFGILVTASLMVPFISTEFHGKGIWLLASAATVTLNEEYFSRLFPKFKNGSTPA